LKDWGRVLLSDTVGFIRDLPHHLVASFKATLEETRQARLLLHVVDTSNQAAEEQIKAVNLVLSEIGCADRPTLLVLNKIDQVPDRSYVDVLMMQHPRAVAVSAVTGQGLEDLREAVMVALSADFADAEIETDAGNGRVIAYLSAHAEIYRQQYVDNRVKIRCFLPRHLLHHIQAPDVQVRFLASDA
jgi:GTP-binding protein HflX